MRRVLSRHPETWDLFENTYLQRRRAIDEGGTFGGPCKALMQALRRVSAELEGSGRDDMRVRYRDHTNEMQEISFLKSEEKKFAHEIREAARAEQWLWLADRRPSYEGIEYGVDRVSTNVLSGKTAGLATYRLRCALVGAVNTCNRLAKAKILESPHCRCCGEEVETLEHTTDACPAFADLRSTIATPDEWMALPVCLRRHGIMPAWEFPMPLRFSTGHPDDRKALAAEIQYLLIDIQDRRLQSLPEMAPCPRWTRNVRPRTANS